MAHLNEIRDMIIQMHGVTNANNTYTIYHDESNNIRSLRLSKSGLNVTEPDCFVLGGILHKGPPRKLEFDELRPKLIFPQQSIQDIKLKHLAKGTFPEILESKKIQIFLQWLLDKELLIHFSVMDVIYWSTVDIIDSILTEPENHKLFPIHRELKNDLHEVLRADLKEPLEILINHSYPNIGKDGRTKFIKSLSTLLNKRSDLLPDFNFRMLSGLLKKALNLESLPYLKDNEPNTLIESFNMIYLHQIMLFKNSLHIFDDEPQIKESLISISVDDKGSPLQNYHFKNSAMEDGIQISDIVIGLIGKCFTFINKNDPENIIAIKSEFSEIQSKNLQMLSSLINLSISECAAFAHYILSNQDMYRRELLFGNNEES